MRTYTCKECGFTYSEADKHWDTKNSTKPCPKCSFAITKVTDERTKKIKLAVITTTVLLILFAVVTNGNTAEYNFIWIAIILFFMSSYILPYIDKKDMTGGRSMLEYNEDNVVPRFIILAFAVVGSILGLYKLLFN